MKSTASHSLLALEILEDRIAPATLVVGGTGVNDHNYDDITVFTEMSAAAASSGTQKSIGNFFNAAEDMYFISFTSGDKLLFNDGEVNTSWLDLKGGTAKMFFHDINHDGLVQKNEATGLSTGGAVKFTFNGDITGDVVGNLKGNGKASVFVVGADPHDVLLQSNSTVTEATINGSVGGSIYMGGKIDKLTISGSVTAIKTGAAANMGANTVSLSGLEPGVGVAGTGHFATFDLAARAVGGSISNVKVAAVDIIAASSGGAGGVGGSISKITITQDTDGLAILAGNGGDTANATNGGAGGKISDISYLSSIVGGQTGDIIIKAGKGGNSAVLGNRQGNGGTGGSVDDVYINALHPTKPTFSTPAAHLGEQDILVASGNGGGGKNSGAGGKVSDVSAYTWNADITVTAGAGGDSFGLAGSAGDGGDLVAVNAAVVTEAANEHRIEIRAGAAGQVDNTSISSGGQGGSVTGVSVAAHTVEIFGGNGSTGKVGGDGGKVAGVSFLPYSPVNSIDIDSGDGAAGAKGAGGDGGDVGGVLLYNNYGNNLTSFQGTNYFGLRTSGDLVISATPPGSNLVLAGVTGSFPGNVTVATYVPGNLMVQGTIEKDFTVQADVWGRIVFTPDVHIKGNFSVQNAAGGIFLLETSGPLIGTLTPISEGELANYVDGTVTLSSDVVSRPVEYYELGFFSASVDAGDGGGEVSNGQGTTVGGKGGSINEVFITNNVNMQFAPPMGASPVNFEVYAGDAGNGLTKGGAGGSLTNVWVLPVSRTGVDTLGIAAGDGGVGGDASAQIKGDGGAGGKIKDLNVSFFDLTEEVYTSTFSAGDGGASAFGGKGGAGGSIDGAAVLTQFATINLLGGKGGAGQASGGVGGDISKIYLEGHDTTYNVQAGDGASSSASVAAAGGALEDILISAYFGNTFNLKGGTGYHGGAGGSIDGIAHGNVAPDLTFQYILNANYTLTAHAGDSTGAVVSGGNGGAIKNVSVLPVASDNALIERIALTAGNGGHGITRGGDGGNVETVSILSSVTVDKQKFVLKPGTQFARVDLNTGTGGNSEAGTKGGKGGDAKTVKWDIPLEINNLNLGHGVDGGPDGKAINVNGAWSPSAIAT